MLIIRTINSNSDWSDQFSKRNAYLTSSWKFHRCIVLELLKLKKIIGIQKSVGKVRNFFLISCDFTKTEKLRVWPSGGGLQGVAFGVLPFDFSMKFLPILAWVTWAI